MGDELTFEKKLENTNEDDLLTIRLGSQAAGLMGFLDTDLVISLETTNC